MKKYNQAPLPFMGQKRKFLKQFKEKLQACPADGLYVDLFGGSGLLSRTVKDLYPNAKVVYNDFDNYRNRIKAIPGTNALIADIRILVAGLPKDKAIPIPIKDEILKRIKQDDECYAVDYITLSANLLFSMNYAISYVTLAKQPFYNVVRSGEYDAADYLEGLKIVSMDYLKLFEKYKKESNVIFLVDPPYLSTEAGSYKGNYWKLADYLNVLTVLNNHAYFYFTSNKSHIVELCNWMSTQTNYVNPFVGAFTSTTHQQMNYSSSYTDIMLFKTVSL
ncbi:DNA adenine methylase [Arachidicoccus soli]|uniref:DNA adenine methylase n=1 Tax=Arachidicoccus soli TaxID=2341117 RepID=A0A386HRJ7_9BACT|nr:DNA adenine methylase [Arachidicoccus soli]AYD48186.1 DNA adenine methylase [Arachidicoccus soli]